MLDIGSGAGNMAHHLAHYGHVIGLDYNARPLAVAAQRGDRGAGWGDDLPFADGSMDIVALLDTVEHSRMSYACCPSAACSSRAAS